VLDCVLHDSLRDLLSLRSTDASHLLCAGVGGFVRAGSGAAVGAGLAAAACGFSCV
jgi:hypothetical protein